MPDLYFANFIEIKNGLFYAAGLTQRDVRIFSKKRGGFDFSSDLNEQLTDAGIYRNPQNKKELLLHQTARHIGANIYLSSQSRGVSLIWENMGNWLPLDTLPKPAANHYYLINFDNTCRKGTDCVKIFRGKKYFSDLPAYYRDVAEPAEGVMDLATKKALIHHLTDAFPCIPISGP